MKKLSDILPTSLNEAIVFFIICFGCFLIGYFFCKSKKVEILKKKNKQLSYENEKLKYIEENKSVLNNATEIQKKLQVVQTRDRDGKAIKDNE